MFRVLPYLILASVLLAGCRELSHPKDGYILVESIDSPVRIQTKDLEGEGWIDSFTALGQWERIFTSAGGSFTFNRVLPADVWHCDSAFGPESCVALLRAGDEQGYLSVSGRFQGKIHVCTKAYVQTHGRRHCGDRAFVKTEGGSFDETVQVGLSYSSSQASDVSDFPEPDASYAWHGDQASRLMSGQHEWRSVNSWHPPSTADIAGEWSELPWLPWFEGPLFAPPISPHETQISVDIGACSIFLPWEWEQRIRDSAWTSILAAQTAPVNDRGEIVANADGSIGRGLAELMLDGMIEAFPHQSRETYSVDAMLWMDSLTGIYDRPDVSPEFHFHVSDEGARQVCLKSYWNVSNDIQTRPDAPYRIDQAIAAGFLSLLQIGNCPTHPMSMRYCGEVRVRAGKGELLLDESATHIAVEPYPFIRPVCNNSFIPALKSNLAAAIEDTAAANLSDGIAQLVDGLSDTLGVRVRRLELTPSGLYVVTATSVDDPQYGIGNCLPDIEHPDVTATLQGPVTTEQTARGIIRF